MQRTYYFLLYKNTIFQAQCDRRVTHNQPIVPRSPACTVAIVSRVGTDFTAIARRLLSLDPRAARVRRPSGKLISEVCSGSQILYTIK